MTRETIGTYIREMTPEEMEELQKAIDEGRVLPYYTPEEEEGIRKLVEGKRSILFDP